MRRTACLNCGREGPIELEMKVKGGQTLSMISCTSCECRTWFADGEQVTSQQALQLAAGDPSFVITPSVKTKRRTAT